MTEDPEAVIEYDFSIPPFEDLYPWDDDWKSPEDGGEPYQPFMTPRKAFHLWAALGYMRDSYAEDRESLLSDLPLAARLVADEEWLTRFLQCFTDMSERLASGTFVYEQLAHCTGEEAALKMTCDYLDDIVAEGDLPPPSRYPRYPGDDDEGWADDLRENLVQDFDVDWLWEVRTALGLPKTMVRQFGPANLEPERWFLPFQNIVDLAHKELPDGPPSHDEPE